MIGKTSLIKSTFKLSLTGSEGLILVAIWKKSVPGRKKNKCTGPKIRECLSHVRKSKTSRVVDGITNKLGQRDIKGYSL